jgi:hypothetical protein
MNLTILKRILILLLAPLVLVGALYLWVVIRTPRPDSGRLVRTADRKLVWSGSQVQVQLHVNLDQELPVRPDNNVRKRHVIALVLDHSSSMGQGPDSPLEAVKSAASIFARTTASDEQPVGVIAFDHSTSEAMPLGPDGEACANAIQQIPSGGGTDIAQGLLAGRSLIVSALESGKYPGASGLIVLLSDGQSDRDQALQAAEQTKTDPQHPIRIVTIGLGAQIDEDLLRKMATTEADFHFTLDPAGLGDIYFTIAEDFGTVIGYNAQLSEQFNYGGFKLEKPPVGFPVQVDKARGRLDFRFPVLFQQRTVIPYTLQAERVGLFGLGLKSADLTYIPYPNAPQQTRQILSPLGPSLLVISPLLLLLLYLPLLGYLLWRLLHRMPPPLPALEPKPAPQITLPPRLPLRDPEPLRERKPQPTLFLGVGEAGGTVLRHVSKFISNDRYLSKQAELPFHLLHVDTRPSTLNTDDTRLLIQKAELPNFLGSAVRELQSSPQLDPHLEWLPRGELTQIGGSQLDLSQGAHGRRWLTRLALFEACKTAATPFLSAWKNAVKWLIEHPKARIVVIGSLQGGTGSALISDLAHLLRHALPENRRAESPVYAFGLADIPSEHSYASLNQQAFLAELDRFSVATEIAQPAIINPRPPSGFEYLNGVIDEPVYDHFFLLQSPHGTNSENIDREFFSEIAAICHTFTEHTSGDSLEAHLGNKRTDEVKYRHEYLEGTVNSAWQHLLRFPVPEISRRLACRFVCEIVGANLVGVTFTADRRSLEPSVPSKNPVEEALNCWSLLSESDRGQGLIYQAFCQAAATDDPRTLVPALQHAAQGAVPSTNDVRDGMQRFATAWFLLLLNGAPSHNDEERAAWCRHKIQLLHAALSRLLYVGEEALQIQKQRGADSSANPLIPVLEEIQRFHEAWLVQTRSWLQTLVDPEFVSPAPEGTYRGTFRSADDESQQIELTLKDERLSNWRSILADDQIQDPRLREDALYQRYIGSFLQQEHGFQLRWFWQVVDESGEGDPRLRLRVVIDQIHDYEPGADTAVTLGSKLFQVADSLTRDLDRITILDALRSEAGELHLEPLAKRLAGFNEGTRGLRIRDRFPIQRQLLVIVPEVQDLALQNFQNELQRHLSFNLTLVQHGDPHSIRTLVLDSVIPIKAAHLQSANSEVLPFICEPEQAGERLRGEITDRLGVAPSPQLHPLTRLLAAAPRRRSEWVGILAENCIKPSFADGIKPILVISDGNNEEPLVSEHQKQSWLWAILNLAYRLKGSGPAETARLRWQARDQRTKIEMLEKAAEALARHTQSLPEASSERAILDQIVLFVRLEHDREQSREEAGR